MAGEPSDFIVPSLVFIFASTVALALWPKRQKHPYPPGPPPKPLIGNALDIPSEKPCLKFLSWSQEYNSDIIHLTAMHIHIVILNKMKDIVELFEKRSSIYSDRLEIPACKIILGAEHLTPLLSYGNEWRKHRRLYQETFGKSIMPSYARVQTEKVHLMLGLLLRSPEKFEQHCKWLSTAVVMAMTFGYDFRPEQEHDRFVELAEETSNGIASLFLPGSTLINVLPFLRHIPPWVPGATTQKFAARLSESMNAYRTEPFEYVERDLAAGSSKPSMLASLLRDRSKVDGKYEDEALLKDVVTTTYLAGGETIQSALTIIFFALALHPTVQKRAQQDIDRVVGSDRLPSLGDRASLPYIDAVLRECLRWRPIVRQSLPRATQADDVYNGFYIPKGTLMIPNVWAITRDEEVYPNSDLFQPERFFNADGTLNDDTVGYAFGFGRRICPGRHAADPVLWLMLASVLSTFDISKARDANGVEIKIDPDAFTDTVISTPHPFVCSIIPRSSQANSLILVAVQDLHIQDP